MTDIVLQPLPPDDVYGDPIADPGEATTVPPDSGSGYVAPPAPDTSVPSSDPGDITSPTGPGSDGKDTTPEDILFYNTTTGIIVSAFRGMKYLNDLVETPSGCAKLVGHAAHPDHAMVVIDGEGNPTFTAIPKITDASSWNVTVDNEPDENNFGFANPQVLDRISIVSGTTATLGAYLPSTITVNMRAPQSTGYPIDDYDFTTTAGAWTFGVTPGYEGDYYLIIKASGYQDYYVHFNITAS